MTRTIRWHDLKQLLGYLYLNKGNEVFLFLQTIKTFYQVAYLGYCSCVEGNTRINIEIFPSDENIVVFVLTGHIEDERLKERIRKIAIFKSRRRLHFKEGKTTWEFVFEFKPSNGDECNALLDALKELL